MTPARMHLTARTPTSDFGELRNSGSPTSENSSYEYFIDGRTSEKPNTAKFALQALEPPPRAIRGRSALGESPLGRSQWLRGVREYYLV
jgi:hypothetical protein